MTSPREVLIYPGASKTGTSALQAVLRCSIEELAAQGWKYLGDPLEGNPDPVGSGNATRLAAALAGRHEADLLAELDQIAPAGERSIIASEGLSTLKRDQWEPLVEALDAEDAKVRVVLCVRDLYPYYASAYGQNVKLAGVTARFEDWDGRGLSGFPDIDDFGLVDRYLAAGEAFGTDRVSILHYETDRGRITEAMLEAGGFSPDSLDLSAGGSLTRPRNRSLTQAEVELMLRINAQVDPYYSEWCGKTLAERGSIEAPGLLYSPQVVEELSAKVQPELDRFNRSLPPDTNWRLSVLDESRYELEPVDPRAAESPEFAEAVRHLLSFPPDEPLRSVLVSLLPEGASGIPAPPGLVRRVVDRVRAVAADLRLD